MTHHAPPLASETFAHALCGALRASPGLAVLVVDEDLAIHDANPFAGDTLGIDGPAIGGGLEEKVHETDTNRLKEALQGGGALAGPYLLRAKSDRDDPDAALLVSVVRVPRASAPDLFTLIGRPAGPEVRREARVLRARRFEIVGQLTGGVAHELNNRLSTVTTFSDLLLGDAEPGSQEAEDLAEIKQAGLDSAVITRKLDLFSGGHAGGATETAMDQVVTGLEKLIRRFVSPEVAVEIDVDPDCPMVPAPPIRVEEIIVALVANARDAMPGGGILTIRARGRASSPDAAGTVILEINDTGEARDVPPLSRAVEPFFSSRSPSTGTGLGLTTVRGIVAGLGGSLEMSAVPGGGATVRVTLPAAGEEIPTEEDENETRHPAQTDRVALVEPDEPLRRSLRRGLESMGVDVTDAGTVVELGNGAVPGVALADVPDAPGAGMAVVKALRARWTDIPVVLMRRRTTMHEFPVDHVGVREISKPLDRACVWRALGEATSSARTDLDQAPGR